MQIVNLSLNTWRWPPPGSLGVLKADRFILAIRSYDCFGYHSGHMIEKLQMHNWDTRVTKLGACPHYGK